MTENPYDNAMNKTILEPYFYFYEKMKDKFKDEQAMQSAIATCMIRYSNLYDKNPTFNQLIKNLTESSTKAQMDYNAMILDYYEPLFRTLPKNLSDKVRLYINEKLKTPVIDLKQFREGLNEYLYRNGWTFEYVCTLSPVLNKGEE